MKIHTLEVGKFKLDGGAMFGVVPKTMWNKLHPADENNMCTWQLRCLLIEDGPRKILIDTGAGNKQGEKFKSHFYPHDELSFQTALGQIGLTCEDITDVFITHFHFDHVGGALEYNKKGDIIPVFPNATYWSNEIHYRWAYDANPREAASFLKENFVPLREQGLLQFLDVEQEIAFSEHIKVSFVNGHTEAMMVPSISLPSGNILVYCADLLPSHHHIGMPYVMAYDMRPLETLKEKQALFDKATDGRHFLYFEHDLDVACGSVKINEKGRVVFDSEVSLESIM